MSTLANPRTPFRAILDFLDPEAAMLDPTLDLYVSEVSRRLENAPYVFHGIHILNEEDRYAKHFRAAFPKLEARLAPFGIRVRVQYETKRLVLIIPSCEMVINPQSRIL